ncbi:peptidase associated/transthyretin-like domain-containing protein [Mangrovimonas spongiae]|uniref:Intradiol ring-cleavage dioxygenases domain-containing protein n=1 Tax=Mangrovimonas spongiae TaxID=2494697 RepID=A0A3R9PHY9_9FLAO|nr:hypothetical protein [Mangrovimonas spongiae]RSK38620.1 hypothetical protein EJA19_11215 [Mangrovimonas spongiae]
MKKLRVLLSVLGSLLIGQYVIAQDAAIQVTEDVPFDYASRHAIYDFSETNLNAIDSIPGFQTKETPLKLTGIVYQPDGITPAKDVIVFIRHANEDGKFDIRTKNEKRYVYHRGWVKTNAKGEYTFYTFIPGSYAHSKELRRIYRSVKVAGQLEYNLPDFIFNDDPFLTKHCRKHINKKGIDCILTTLKKENYYLAEKNIVLRPAVIE